MRLIEQISDSSVNVLITGERGTGKELVARVIHYSSPRARRPFVTLNCAVLPESLLDSELFGVEREVTTGIKPPVGKFEAAEGGTLFLDEVDALSLPTQAGLLRALQRRMIERVGGRKPIPVDVRILAATNKDLDVESKKGTFHQDLYHRLKVVHVEMPPLREIPKDIPLLANYFLAKYCRGTGKDPMTLGPQALKRLTVYAWPGNVRELEHEMKRLSVSVTGITITEKDLSEAIRRGSGRSLPGKLRPERALKQAVAELEKRMIGEALREYRHNRQHAARALGLSRQGLIKKMKRYGLTSFL